jgi:hypothetical protein
LTEVENPMINFKETEPKVVGECAECFNSLTENDELVKCDNELFCDLDCVHDYLGIIEIGGWEI